MVLVKVPLVWNFEVEKEGRKLRRGLVLETSGKEAGFVVPPSKEKFCVMRLLREKVGCSVPGTVELPVAMGTSEIGLVRFRNNFNYYHKLNDHGHDSVSQVD